MDLSRGRVTLSTKKLERTPGDMPRDPQLVYEGAEEMAEAYRERMKAEAASAAEQAAEQEEQEEQDEEQEGAGEEAEEGQTEAEAAGLEVRPKGGGEAVPCLRLLESEGVWELANRKP